MSHQGSSSGYSRSEKRLERQNPRPNDSAIQDQGSGFGRLIDWYDDDANSGVDLTHDDRNLRFHTTTRSSSSIGTGFGRANPGTNLPLYINHSETPQDNNATGEEIQHYHSRSRDIRRRQGNDDLQSEYRVVHNQQSEIVDDGKNIDNVPDLPPSALDSAIRDIPLDSYYADHVDYMARKLADYRAKLSQLPTSNDPTIPRTQTTRERCVRQLINAIKNRRSTIDKKKTHGGSQAEGKLKKLSDSELERVVWELLDLAIDAQNGIGLFPECQELKAEIYDSFQIRWRYVLHAAHYSKALCKMQFDALHTTRLAARPQAEIASRGANAKLNMKRDKESHIGRRAMQGGLTPEDLLQIEEEEKTSRTTKSITPRKRKSSGMESPQSKTPKVESATTVPDALYRYSLREKDNDESPTKKQRTAVSPVMDSSEHRQIVSARASPSDLAPSKLPVAAVPSFQAQRSTLINPTDDTADKSTFNSRIRLCDLLQVDYRWAGILSLFQLRAYARAYNSAFGDENYYHFPGYCGYHAGILELDSPYKAYHHFAHAFPEFLQLAIERGDLDANGATMGGRNEFNVDMEDWESQYALGTISHSLDGREQRIFDRPRHWYLINSIPSIYNINSIGKSPPYDLISFVQQFKNYPSIGLSNDHMVIQRIHEIVEEAKPDCTH